MHLTLIPRRGLPGQPATTLHVAGDVLTVDTEATSFADVPEGGEAWPVGEDHPFVGPITRKDGVIHARLRVRIGPDAARHRLDDPAQVVIPDAEGAVDIPYTRKEAAHA